MNENQIDDGGPVYPPSFEVVEHPYDGNWPEERNGITRRNQLADNLIDADYQEFCSSIYQLHLEQRPNLDMEKIVLSGIENFIKHAIPQAYEIADAMIAEGNKQ